MHSNKAPIIRSLPITLFAEWSTSTIDGLRHCTKIATLTKTTNSTLVSTEPKFIQYAKKKHTQAISIDLPILARRNRAKVIFSRSGHIPPSRNISENAAKNHSDDNTSNSIINVDVHNFFESGI
jgi:hypothetical protein